VHHVAAVFDGDIPLPCVRRNKIPYTLNLNCSNCGYNGRFLVDYVDFYQGGITYLEPIFEDN